MDASYAATWKAGPSAFRSNPHTDAAGSSSEFSFMTLPLLLSLLCVFIWQGQKNASSNTKIDGFYGFLFVFAPESRPEAVEGGEEEDLRACFCQGTAWGGQRREDASRINAVLEL